MRILIVEDEALIANDIKKLKTEVIQKLEK